MSDRLCLMPVDVLTVTVDRPSFVEVVTENDEAKTYNKVEHQTIVKLRERITLLEQELRAARQQIDMLTDPNW